MKKKTEKQGKLLQTQLNATDNEQSSTYLRKFEQIEKTPFTMMIEEDGVTLLMGKYVVKQNKFENPNEAINYVNKKPWDLIMIASSIFTRETIEEYEKQNKK